jgi:UDP-GlcNAc3NAcA epimerase
VARLKVVTVVGARPQFIKAAAVTPRLRLVAEEVLVHTGQHYDAGLSQVFFDELRLPPPEVWLGVGSGSHGVQTGRMLEALDPVLERERPDWVLVYGDTNSTLAGALSAAKWGMRVAHVEAGLRSYNRAMPEEINRVLTDHLATRLYCPAPFAAQNLAREGITRGVVVSGDVMDDAVREVPRDQDLLPRLGLQPHRYYLATVHRQENTDRPERLTDILRGLRTLDGPVVWPLHPRTRDRIHRFGLEKHLARFRVLEPLGYRASLTLIEGARAVLTDSGGIQREAAALGVPVYVLRDETEWVDLVEDGRAVLVGTAPDRLLEAVREERARPRRRALDDSPADRVVADLTGEGAG